MGASIELLEILEKAHAATVLKLTGDALVSAEAAVADLAKQMAHLTLPAGAPIRQIVVHVSRPENKQEPEMTVLAAIQDWLDDHLFSTGGSSLICSEEAASIDKNAVVHILLTSKNRHLTAVAPGSIKLSIEDEIGARLHKLWQKPEYQTWDDLDWIKHAPLYPTSLMTNGVLVLGINPSLNVDHLNLPHYEADWKVGSDYFGRLTRFKQDVEKVYQRFQGTVTEGEINTFEALPWLHIDVLYVRETNQARFREEMGRAGVAAFLWEQTQITKALLNKAQPRLMIVANAFARELLGKNVNPETKQGTWMGLAFTEQPDLHTGNYHCTSLPGSPPVFFTGSLAGSNPRDKAADERLTWQIARCLLPQQNSDGQIAMS